MEIGSSLLLWFESVAGAKAAPLPAWVVVDAEVRSSSHARGGTVSSLEKGFSSAVALQRDQLNRALCNLTLTQLRGSQAPSPTKDDPGRTKRFEAEVLGMRPILDRSRFVFI